MGAFSFTGVLAVIAVVLAALFASALIGLRGKRLSSSSNATASAGVRLGLDVPSR